MELHLVVDTVGKRRADISSDTLHAEETVKTQETPIGCRIAHSLTVSERHLFL
jgi:hypothetical protein